MNNLVNAGVAGFGLLLALVLDLLMTVLGFAGMWPTVATVMLYGMVVVLFCNFLWHAGLYKLLKSSSSNNEYLEYLDSLFSVSAVLYRNIPNYLELLKKNVLVEDSESMVTKQAKAIQSFYESRKIYLEFVGFETSPKRNIIRFRKLYIIKNNKEQVITSNVLTAQNCINDLTSRLGLASGDIMFDSIVPGMRDIVSFTIPSSKNNTITLRNIFDDEGVQKHIAKNTIDIDGESYLNGLPMLLGYGNEPVFYDMTDSPHLLIAGSTNSGKSVCINTLIVSLVLMHSPASLELQLVDPKQVELTPFKSLPHTKKFTTDANEVLLILNELVDEMNERYDMLNKSGARNLQEYNDRFAKTRGFVPYIVLVIDEFANVVIDLKTQSSDFATEFFDIVSKIGQLSRAAGIMLCLATQRPDINYITGAIKTNLATRVSFKLPTDTDSRVVLDSGSAALLKGKGDGYLLLNSELVRFQGCYTTDTEINKVKAWWKDKEEDPLPIIDDLID